MSTKKRTIAELTKDGKGDKFLAGMDAAIQKTREFARATAGLVAATEGVVKASKRMQEAFAEDTKNT